MGRKKKVVKPKPEMDMDVEIDKTLADEALKELPEIAPLPTDFGRVDLNTMAAKINELIERINQ